MRALFLSVAASALFAVACNAQSPASGTSGNAPASSGGAGQAVDYGEANTPEQRPAFAGQTRAPAVSVSVPVQTEVVARGLDRPWAVEMMPDGRLIVTEKEGRLRIVGRDGRLGEPIAGVPRVDARDQGGLLDVALQPDFASSRRIWISYAEPQEGGRNNTAVAVGTLAADDRSLTDVRVVWRQQPAWDSTKHFGSRIAFDGQGHVFITTGERSNPEPRVFAQDLGAGLGKVIRLNLDGSVPRDNPFVGRQGALPEIWSYGHRNLQSAAVDAQGRLWTVEHGPRGGDELNLPLAGRNYGWPVITYGEEYSGQPVGQGLTAREGMEQPVYYWDPVIAPSGMVVYSGSLAPQWRGDIFIGGLRTEGLVRLTLQNDRVVGEERMPLGARTRDVTQGGDGALYAALDNGTIVRVSPRR